MRAIPDNTIRPSSRRLLLLAEQPRETVVNEALFAHEAEEGQDFSTMASLLGTRSLLEWWRRGHTRQAYRRCGAMASDASIEPGCNFWVPFFKNFLVVSSAKTAV